MDQKKKSFLDHFNKKRTKETIKSNLGSNTIVNKQQQHLPYETRD